MLFHLVRPIDFKAYLRKFDMNFAETCQIYRHRVITHALCMTRPFCAPIRLAHPVSTGLFRPVQRGVGFDEKVVG